MRERGVEVPGTIEEGKEGTGDVESGTGVQGPPERPVQLPTIEPEPTVGMKILLPKTTSLLRPRGVPTRGRSDTNLLGKDRGTGVGLPCTSGRPGLGKNPQTSSLVVRSPLVRGALQGTCS